MNIVFHFLILTKNHLFGTNIQANKIIFSFLLTLLIGAFLNSSHFTFSFLVSHFHFSLHIFISPYATDWRIFKQTMVLPERKA